MITFITAFYGALLGLLFLALSVRTVRVRRRLQINLGHRGDKEMLRAIRVHGNFAEYVPITLLLIFVLEFEGANTVLIHVLCISLLLGRLAHAYGVSQTPDDFRFRAAGVLLTWAALAGTCLCLLLAFIW